MKRPRILVLCGGRFALPAIQQLGIEGYVAGIVIGKGELSVVNLLEEQCSQAAIPFHSLQKAAETNKLISLIEDIKPDAVFSICYPFLVPANLLDNPNCKFINFHTGPLPGYRGPMPIFEVLRRNEPETQIAVHLMSNSFDEGDLIFSENVLIESGETFGSLATKMSLRTALTAQSMAQMLEFGSMIPREPQNNIVARYFEFPEKEDTMIQWQRMGGEEILSLINACNPWNNGADAILNGKPVKIIYAELFDSQDNNHPGDILEVDQNAIYVSCRDDFKLAIKIISCDLGILSADRYSRAFINIHSTV